jgi:hypothetical protein
MKDWSTIGTGIETRLAADASFSIRYNSFGSGNALPGLGGADGDARWLFTVLTDDGHKDGDLFPLLDPYP